MKMYYGDKEVNYVFQGNSKFPLEQSTFWLNDAAKGFKNVAERRLEFDTDTNSILGVKEGEHCSEILYIPRKMYNDGTGAFINIDSIETSAFLGCEDLKKLVLNTYTIRQNAFADCANLEALDLEEGINSIDDEAFCDCVSLFSITIPSSVTNIGTNPFRGCGLSSIWVNDENNNYTDFGSNAIFELNDDGFPYKLITGCEITQLDQRFYDDNLLTEIGDYAFVGCSQIDLADLPESVTTIGKYAFAGITYLGEFHLENLTQLTEIKEGAFAGCSTLDNITLPDTIEKFGAESFKDCTNLQRFDIPATIMAEEDLGENMFEGCSNIQDGCLVDNSGLITEDNYAYFGIERWAMVSHPSEINLFAYDEEDNPINSTDEDGNDVSIKGII